MLSLDYPDLIWWIVTVDLPIVTSFLVFFWRQKKDVESRIDLARTNQELINKEVNADLANFKLLSAQSYATSSDLLHVEDRLSDQLRRIEDKLDAFLFQAQIPNTFPSQTVNTKR